MVYTTPAPAPASMLVTPPVGMTARQFRGYQKILEQVLLYLASANRGISNIEHHPDVNQKLSIDSLNALKDKHRETTRKYDEAYNSLFQNDLDDSEPDQQQAQISQVMDVSRSTLARKQDEACFQTKLKMDMLLVDLNVLSVTILKYIPPNTLEDFMIVQAMKLRNDWRTQATSMTKKMLEIKPAISQWDLTDLEQEADTLKSKVANRWVR